MTIQNRIAVYKQAGREWFTRNVNTIKVFSIHHDAIPQDNRTADQVMTQIFNTHKANGWPGASYHYYIHRDGTVYQINKHEWVTWIDGVNWDAIGIVLNGYFHSPYNNNLTKEQLRSLKELLDDLSTNHPEFPASQKDTYAHRERAQTACPGDKAYSYVKEYRDKNGQVDWGNPPTPNPPNNADSERALGIVNQVKVRDGHGNLEGAARAMDEATKRVKILEAENEEMGTKITLTKEALKVIADKL